MVQLTREKNGKAKERRDLPKRGDVNATLL